MFDGRQAGVIDLSDFDVPVFRHLILVPRHSRCVGREIFIGMPNTDSGGL